MNTYQAMNQSLVTKVVITTVVFADNPDDACHRAMGSLMQEGVSREEYGRDWVVVNILQLAGVA